MTNQDEQAIINEFCRKYVSKAFRPRWNHKAYEMKNGPEHDEAVHRVCYALKARGIQFATEVRMVCGNCADVVAPGHIMQIIEVMKSETSHGMAEKILRYPREVRGEIKVLCADDVLSLSMNEVKEGVFIL